MSHAVIFFDGYCCLCNAWLRFVLRHEREAYFQFAPLQSLAARQQLQAFGYDTTDLSSVVVLEQGQLYLKSDAALKVLSHMRWPYRATRVFVFLPRRLRDWVYDLIGRMRYRLFGRAPFCAVATDGVRARFLEGSFSESDYE